MVMQADQCREECDAPYRVDGVFAKLCTRQRGHSGRHLPTERLSPTRVFDIARYGSMSFRRATRSGSAGGVTWVGRTSSFTTQPSDPESR